jgi:hypothetical protein
MTTLLGIAVFIAWFWSVYIIVKKTKKTTNLEKTVMCVALGGFILYILGTI